MLGFSKWSPSLRFPHLHPVLTPSLPIRATCPAHLSLLDLPNNIWWEIQSVKLVVMSFYTQNNTYYVIILAPSPFLLLFYHLAPPFCA
jgi:hypothetical protein